MNIVITNIKTNEVKTIPAVQFEEYCKQRNWESHIIKQHFNTRVHYANNMFYLVPVVPVEDVKEAKPTKPKPKPKRTKKANADEFSNKGV